MNEKTLLKIENLKTYFTSSNKTVKAVDGVDIEIKNGETLGLVGESGSGKSVTALSVLRLIPTPPGKILNGKIFFQGKNLLDMKSKEMRRIRGNKISMIFQEPMTSLNPVFTIGNQIAEAVILHQKLKKKEAYEKTLEMLKKVSIPSPEKRINEYPHQLSGGMRQRVMIAMALSCNPMLLLADEPTTALDVTIQAQILDLIGKLKEEINMSVMLITHDLGIVAETCQTVAVMYAGKIVELGDVFSIFEETLHPYTKGLLASAARLESGGEKKLKLAAIPGTVPHPAEFSEWCRFESRCSIAEDFCKKENPELVEKKKGHWVRCFKA
ncbi:MAG: peptide ABC transporter ATP-binding protein [Candidatus Schekmanbacteria bacterium RBG_16_38_10]|uniref:Peptide ABC transporter ATP-binding protein n=1 Tax=Candidatus Schekmanbacteria bacterium RBG_16_38_10 TaxID=1817879 RepID=A0A1F7S0S3_9BACT|nr:MAG: peptide ABC transporter ATP-binding protein [Candidatus Schekmanbacteria bacterium RBG_16_38_10]